MTEQDGLTLLRRVVSEADDPKKVAAGLSGGGQAVVARRLGYSSTAISQALNNKYGGNLDTMLAKVVEVYGGMSVVCPVLGMIRLARCGQERRKPFGASNPTRVRLYRQCKQCEHNR